MARSYALSVLLLGCLQPELFAPNDPVLANYLNLLARYRTANSEETAGELLSWSSRRISESISRLEEQQKKQSKKRASEEAVRFFDAAVRTAVVLHTHAGVLEGTRSTHFEIARRLLDLAKGEEAERKLRKDWLLVVASYHFVLLETEEAMRYLDEAERLFHEDADVLLLAGALHEVIGSLSKDPDRIQKAGRYYREVIRRHPEHVEAHLRWGRVLFTGGDTAGATRELSWALDHARDKRLRHLALLFRGDLLESEGRWQDARESYRSAVDVDPGGQVAYVGLAHALYREGDHQGARAALENVFRRNASSRLDEWWVYRQATLDRWEERLDRMRRELN